MKPSKSILDPSFAYTNSAKTDIRKTFAKARRAMRQEIGAEYIPAQLLPFTPTRKVRNG
jgi:hypothetical protein